MQDPTPGRNESELDGFEDAGEGFVEPESVPYGLPAIPRVTYGDSVLDEPWFWALVAVVVLLLWREYA